jgi:hypothetical protein
VPKVSLQEAVTRAVLGYEKVFDGDIPRGLAAIATLRHLGFAVVPIEPTETMLASGDSAMPQFERDVNGTRMMGREGALACWRAMVEEGLR